MLTLDIIEPYMPRLRTREVTQAEVARALGTDAQTLHTFLRRKGLLDEVRVGRGGSRKPYQVPPGMQEAISGVLAGQSIRAVATDRGIRYATLHAWVAKARQQQKETA